MSGLIRTPADAFAAGLVANCEHGLGYARCPACRLTEDEIARMAIIHRPYVQPRRETTHRAA